VILVVEAGKIVERGTHEELLALGGKYHSLYNKQYEEESVAEIMGEAKRKS
jgi:ABC-type multidrug transport system fused ATPase/permease subunit